MKAQLWALLILVIILAIIGAVYPYKALSPQDEENQESAIRELVADFGTALKNVSLLAPRENVAQSMQENYGKYVTPELLGEWANDPALAPGRLTSSPWPERIEIASIQKKNPEENNGGYIVEGQIIEVTNEGGGIATSPTEAARRPISLMVEKTGLDNIGKDKSWRITSVTLGAYPGDGNWKYSEPNAQGIQFMYPEKLPTTYIVAEVWPPEVMLAAGEYSCAEQDEGMVGDRAYCVVKNSEGAAGSAYTVYEYTTAQGDFLAHVKFTLRFPECMNYDELEQDACKQEQSAFDVDGLVDRIASSIRML